MHPQQLESWLESLLGLLRQSLAVARSIDDMSSMLPADVRRVDEIQALASLACDLSTAAVAEAGKIAAMIEAVAMSLL